MGRFFALGHLWSHLTLGQSRVGPSLMCLIFHGFFFSIQVFFVCVFFVARTPSRTRRGRAVRHGHGRRQIRCVKRHSRLLLYLFIYIFPGRYWIVLFFIRRYLRRALSSALRSHLLIQPTSFRLEGVCVCVFKYLVLPSFFFSDLQLVALGLTWMCHQYWPVFTGLFLVVVDFSRLFGFLGFYLVLLGLTWFYWILLDITGFYWVLMGFTRLYQVILGYT